MSFLLGKDETDNSDVYIEPFHTLFAGQTNLSGKTTTVIALAGEAVKEDYTVLLFDTKPTIREFENVAGFHDIPVCYQPTTDPLVLIGLLEGIFKRKLTMYFATLGRVSERAKDVKDVIRNSENFEKRAKGGFLKDAAHTLADLLRRLDNELSQIQFSSELELREAQINVMPINGLSNEAQQLVLKTAFEQVLKHHNRKTILVVDEAFRFIPQDYSSACKKLVQDVITVGAKTKLFVWISTQFLAPTDKDPLKACPNKLFGRQDHNTEIDATIKLVPGGKGLLDPKQLMTLKRGQFMFVPLEGNSRTVRVIPPWERAVPKVQDSELISDLRHDIGALEHELEKEQKAHESTKQSIGILQSEVESLKQTIKERGAFQGEPMTPTIVGNVASNSTAVMEVNDPVRLIQVNDPQEPIKTDTTTIRGQIAQLILEGDLSKGFEGVNSLREKLIGKFGGNPGTHTIMDEMMSLVAPPFRLFTVDPKKRFRLRTERAQTGVKS